MQVVSAVEGLARDGFVNYFGLQRFGSGLSATHQWVPGLSAASNPEQLDSWVMAFRPWLCLLSAATGGAALQDLLGTRRVCCRVGALLLNGKWEAAARLILQGPADDRPDIAAARAAFLEKGKATLCTPP